MSRRREVEGKLHSLQEIKGIMTSMKNISLVETHKLRRLLASQQSVVRGIEEVAEDFLQFQPAFRVPSPSLLHLYLLIGAERGFCGDFNERLLKTTERALAADSGIEARCLAVGRKLCAALEGDPRVLAFLAGPSVVAEVPAILSRVLESLGALQAEHGPASLSIIHHTAEQEEIPTVRLLPPFQETPAKQRRFASPPRLYLPAALFFAGLVEHYLFAALNEIFYTSLMAEHLHRVQHLDAATHRLEEQAAELSLKRNTLRQEEITEEIEVILLSTEALA